MILTISIYTNIYIYIYIYIYVYIYTLFVTCCAFRMADEAGAMIGNGSCWLHQIHLPWLGSSKVRRHGAPGDEKRYPLVAKELLRVSQPHDNELCYRCHK